MRSHRVITGSLLGLLALVCSSLSFGQTNLNQDFGGQNTGAQPYYSRLIQLTLPVEFQVTNPGGLQYGIWADGNQMRSTNNWFHTQTDNLIFEQFDVTSTPTKSLARSGTKSYAIYQGSSLKTTVFVNWTSSGTVTYLSGGTMTPLTFVFQPIRITYNAQTNAIDIQNPNGGPPPTTCGIRQMLLNNLTSADVKVMMGNQEVTLKPGINQLRYQGGIDADGNPTELGSNFVGKGFTGSDGTKYHYAEYSGWGEFAGWKAPPPGDYTVTGDPAQGAMFTRPSNVAGGAVNMVGLKPTRPVTLPTTQRPANQTWPGLANPTTGAPVAVAAPSTGSTTNTITAGSVGGGTGSGGAPVVATGQTGEGGFYNAPGLDDVLGDGDGKAQGLKDAITGKADALKGKTWKWWNIQESGLGQDSSWLNTSVVIAGTSHKLIKIDPDFLPWMRSMFLLMVKVSFVFAIIKLVMK